MDHLVTRRQRRISCRIACCIACVALLGMVAVSSGHAETLQDPTRPASAAFDAASAGTAAGSGVPAVPVYQLQSVLIGRGAGGRRVAVINGQILRVGEHVQGQPGSAPGAALLMKISDGEVVLRSGARLQTLKLFSAPVKPAGATTAVEHEE